MADLKPGSRVGPWTLVRPLGAGGNATVWVATRGEAEPELALKILNTARADREPYKRFVREISFLRGLPDATGILPLIDAGLPDEASGRDRPWLAMPIATGIADALAGVALEGVVAAVLEMATTLARLAVRGVAHRDLKPANLYSHNGASLVGDFGLVRVPDLDELTRNQRPLGPAHFIPYEMILNPADADPHAADVYSLGKTLWVLAAEQRFPPDGHQPAVSRGFSIADFRSHPNAQSLDQLVDRMTRLQPKDRPSMSQVVRDLGAWSALAADPVTIDVSGIRARLREKLRTKLDEEDLQQRLKDEAHAAVRRFQELFAALHRALQDVHPSAEIDLMSDSLTQNILRSPAGMGRPPAVFHWQRCSQIGRGPTHFRYTLRIGRSIELAPDGELAVRSLIAVGHPTIGGGDNFFWQSQPRTAPVGTIEVESALREVVDELRNQLPTALEHFVNHAD